MSFRIRANTRHQLCVQINEVNGNSFYQIINVEPDWNNVTLPYAELQPNGKTQGPGRVDPARIVKVLLIDFSATVKPPRKGRTVWLTDWKFATGLAAASAPKPTTGKVGFTAEPEDFQET